MNKQWCAALLGLVWGQSISLPLMAYHGGMMTDSILILPSIVGVFSFISLFVYWISVLGEW